MVCTYLIAAELSKIGLIVTVTARNAQGIDILAASSTGKTFSIQAKGHAQDAKRNYWLLNKDYKKFVDNNLYYIFVNLTEAGTQNYYIVPSKRVASEGEIERSKTGAVWYWISQDVVEKYKDRWDFFK